MPSSSMEDDHMREAREFRVLMTSTMAKIEERMDQYEELVKDTIRMMRGDGNGDRGLIIRMERLHGDMRELSHRLGKVEEYLSKNSQLATAVAKSQWRTLGQIASVVGAIVTSAVALLIALYKKS